MTKLTLLNAVKAASYEHAHSPSCSMNWGGDESDEPEPRSCWECYRLLKLYERLCQREITRRALYKRLGRLAQFENAFDLECPCCGDVGALWPQLDGDPLICGCKGHVSCDAEEPPYINADDCGCNGDRP